MAVVMLPRMTRPMSLLLLISMFGIINAHDGWGVTYTQKSVCALKGSTVIMDCTYTYPPGYKVQTAFWSKELHGEGIASLDLASDPMYRGKVQYIGDKNNKCTLKLTDVTEKDQTTYYLRFSNDEPENTDGVQLCVTGIQEEGPETVKEGTAVNLTCKTTCTLTDNSTFTWYRNQQELNTTNTSYYSHPYHYYCTQLYLQPVRMDDGGQYQCAVGNNISTAVTFNVEYHPKNVSVSVSPLGEIMEGSSVSLTCSSDAKPAASYQLYKGTSYKATGETFTIHKIRSDDGGDYRCWARNEHGDQNSTAVNIDVHYHPRSISVSVEPSGEIKEGSLVTLTCSADANPPVENYTWYKEQTYKGRGETLTVRNISSEDGGEYKCKCSYKNQFKYSGPVAVKVLYPPKRISMSVSSSAEPDQSGLVNLTSSADADPPVESYTWYKDGGSSAVGSGQSYSARLGFSMIVCIAVGVGVGLCLVAAVFVVFFCWRRKMQMRQKDKRDHKDADADTYAALDPSSRSSNNEYDTLTIAHSGPPDDTYATLDPEYENLTMVRNEN